MFEVLFLFSQGLLGSGFKHFLFSPLPGEMIQFDERFSNGLKHVETTVQICPVR